MRDGLGGIESVAIIGGSSEIGVAIAEALLTLGARRFILAGRNPQSMQAASPLLPEPTLVHLDVADFASHQTSVSEIFEGGDLDVVVFAAGTLHSAPDAAQVAEMAIVNGAGSTALLAEVGEYLRAQGHGHLVVLSSMAVVRPRPSNYWYGASKVGLDFAARGLSDDLKGAGVRVSTVRPGFVHTRMTDGMRAPPLSCRPHDVGRAVMSAVRRNRGDVLWVPGALKYLAMMLRFVPLNLLRRIDR